MLGSRRRRNHGQGLRGKKREGVIASWGGALEKRKCVKKTKAERVRERGDTRQLKGRRVLKTEKCGLKVEWERGGGTEGGTEEGRRGPNREKTSGKQVLGNRGGRRRAGKKGGRGTRIRGRKKTRRGVTIQQKGV